MRYMKKFWLNEIYDDLFTITFKSEYPNDYRILKPIEGKFPNNPDELHPLRHTIILKPLGYNDLVELYNKIGEFLKIDDRS